MEIKRDTLEEELPETFDLSLEVKLSELSDSDLLFRESIIKAFYETVIRTGNPVYGFTKIDLEEQYNKVVEEFKSRGRDYLVPLDRNMSNEDTIKEISRRRKNKDIYKSKKNSKDFFRFITDPEVRLREHDFETGKCHHCQYFSNMRCSVLEHMVRSEQVCDAYSGSYFYEDADRKYVIENFNSFIRGLVDNHVLQNTVVRSLDSPVGILILFRDNMKPTPHYFSVTISEFIENTVSKHHWTQEEVNNISRSPGGTINE